MKRLLSILLAATVVAAPLAGAAQDRRGDERRAERNERRLERNDRRYERDNRGYDRNDGRYGRPRGIPVAPPPPVAAPAPRDIPGRMTADRFNYRGGYARQPGPAVRPWARGQYLPQEYWGSVVPDPGRYRLRQPPYGYSWVGVGRDIYLMQDSTGLILDSIPGAF